MRHLILIPVLLILISCHETTDGAFPNGIQALKNGATWKGKVEMHLDDATDSLTILGITEESVEEVIVMKMKFTGPGKYTLHPGRVLFYSLLGGDAVTSEYKMEPGAHGEVEVFTYEPDSKAISGGFSFKLKKDRSVLASPAEYLDFTDGFFYGVPGQY